MCSARHPAGTRLASPFAYASGLRLFRAARCIRRTGRQVDVRGIEVPEVAEDELLALEEDTGETDDVIDDTDEEL